jgi:2-phosphosulfolactate phosphatase
MKIDIVYNRSELNGLQDKTVIMIDVLRASTTIVSAFAVGCNAIIPAEEVADAFALQKKDESLILCGERQGKKPQGFQLGNSPLEYNREAVGGKKLVYTTTNGTRALLASQGASNVLIGSFVNLRAAVHKALSLANDIIILCAGREGAFSFEDAFCAGLMVDAVNSSVCNLEIEDGARWGFYAVKSMKGVLDNLTDSQIHSVIANTKHGQYLNSIGLQDDLAFCARQNIFDIVPEYKSGEIAEYDR